MSLSDAYATAALYRAQITMTDTAQDAEILTDLKAVSRYIEGKLGRFFNVDVSDATRLFIPRSASATLYIDDLSAAPTSIKVDEDGDGSFADETAYVTTDYELQPLNAAIQPEAWPYTRIVIPSWSTKGNWPAGGRVQIVGKFGWPAVPEPIRAACIQLTAILRLESPRATNRIAEMDQVIGTSNEAQAILRG